MFVMQHVGLSVDNLNLKFHENLIKNKKVMCEKVNQIIAPTDP